MVGVSKEEESEEQPQKERQDEAVVICERRLVKNVAYGQQEEQNDAEHVLVVWVCV